MEHEVNMHGEARWQGNKINLREASRGPLDREVNKKQSDQIKSNFPIQAFKSSIRQHIRYFFRSSKEE